MAIMTGSEINALADRVETAGGEHLALEERVTSALGAAFGAVEAAAAPGMLRSTDAALHAADTLFPGWEISMKGVAREPDGHWTCTLRETSVTDDDAVIGIGTSAALPSALTAALLRIAASRLSHG